MNKSKTQKKREKNMTISNTDISTTHILVGREVTENLGLVMASTARAKNIGADIVASVRNVFGGEMTEYSSLLGASREQALDRLKAEAEKLGADAIIGLNMETSTISQGVAEIVAYGTAVKTKSL